MWKGPSGSPLLLQADGRVRGIESGMLTGFAVDRYLGLYGPTTSSVVSASLRSHTNRATKRPSNSGPSDTGEGTLELIREVVDLSATFTAFDGIIDKIAHLLGKLSL